jgi:hypothetical protein
MRVAQSPAGAAGTLVSALPWQGNDVVELHGNSVLSLEGVLKVSDMALTTFKLTYRLLQQHIMYGKAPCRETCLLTRFLKTARDIIRLEGPAVRALFAAHSERGVAGAVLVVWIRTV